MPDQPQPANDRFKAEMPQIPGIEGSASRSAGAGGPLLVIGGLVAVLVAVLVGGRLLSKSHRADTVPPPSPQIDVPASPPELPVPVAAEGDPTIAQIGDLAKPWDSRTFSYHNRATGENVTALLVRLPGGSPAQASGYWALAMKEAYGSCGLEYVDDLAKLRNDYGFGQAKHPMIGNPCSRTLYDPTKYASLPGGVLARGAIAQGSDLRPPLGIEIKVRGKQILATRME
jgi:hypothetical protein